jgi:hypothetical protein
MYLLEPVCRVSAVFCSVVGSWQFDRDSVSIRGFGPERMKKCRFSFCSPSLTEVLGRFVLV